MGWLKKKKKAIKEALSAPKVSEGNKKRVVSKTVITGGTNIANWNRPRIEALVHVTISIATLHYLTTVLHYGTKRLVKFTKAHNELIETINSWRYSKGKRGVSLETIQTVLEEEGVYHYRPRVSDKIPEAGHDNVADWASVQAANISAKLLPSYEVPFIMTLYDYMGEAKMAVKKFAVWLYNLDIKISDIRQWIEELSAIRRARINGNLERPCVDWQRDVLNHLEFGGNKLTDDRGLVLMDSKVEAEAACRYLSQVWELSPGGISQK